MTAVIEMHTVYELGSFRLDTEARVLTHDGVATTLGARGVAVLAAVVGRAGQYVERSVIVDAAWPGVVVPGRTMGSPGTLPRTKDALRRGWECCGGKQWLSSRAANAAEP